MCSLSLRYAGPEGGVSGVKSCWTRRLLPECAVSCRRCCNPYCMYVRVVLCCVVCTPALCNLPCSPSLPHQTMHASCALLRTHCSTLYPVYAKTARPACLDLRSCFSRGCRRGTLRRPRGSKSEKPEPDPSPRAVGLASRPWLQLIKMGPRSPHAVIL